MTGNLVSGNSDESDSVDRPVAGQNSDQPAAKDTMTFSKCLTLLVVFEIVLGFFVLLLATLMAADLRLAGLAWLVCAVGTVLAHVFSWFPRGAEFLMLRLAGGMVSRTLLPLGFAIWGLKFCEPRIETSIVLILVLVYMAGLVADSYLNLSRSRAGVQL